jgi:hypothetical protein
MPKPLITDKPLKGFSITVEEEVRDWFADEARRRRVSASHLWREAAREYMQREEANPDAHDR